MHPSYEARAKARAFCAAWRRYTYCVNGNVWYNTYILNDKIVGA